MRRALLLRRFFYGLLAIVVVGLVGSFLRGFPSLRILSSSMAPTFSGPRWSFQCPECGRTGGLTVDFPLESKLETTRFATCPFCGFSEIPIASASFEWGDDVRLRSRWLFEDALKRWEPVAFDKSEETAFGLKRIVGLPGESVEIDRGDLRVNGRIVTKQNFAWNAVRLETIRPIQKTDRVLFQNRPPKPFFQGETSGEATPAPITNVPTMNRVEPIPTDRIENVRDFLMEFSLGKRDERTSDLKLLVNQGDLFWLTFFDRQAETVTFYQTLNPTPEKGEEGFFALTEASFPPESATTIPFAEESGTIRLAFYDRSAVLSIGEGPELARIPEVSRSAPLPIIPVTTPFAILTDQPFSTEALDAFRFFRDVHYSIPEAGRSEWTLEPGEYLLLGDNSAVSIDARDWNPPVVRREKIWRIAR